MNEWTDIVIDFAQRVKQAQEEQQARLRKDATFFHPPIIIARSHDWASLGSAWVWFQHRTIEEFWSDGCWKLGTFQYTVWLYEYRTQELSCLLERDVHKERSVEACVSSWSLAGDIDHVAVAHGVVYVRDPPRLKAAKLEVSWYKNWLQFERKRA